MITIEKLPDRAYRYLFSATLAIIGVGTVFYHIVEKFSWVDAYYFSVITLATVGYGDLTPQTTLGKIFTTLYIFVGVGIITAFISHALRRRASSIAEHRHNKNHADE